MVMPVVQIHKEQPVWRLIAAFDKAIFV